MKTLSLNKKLKDIPDLGSYIAEHATEMSLYNFDKTGKQGWFTGSQTEINLKNKIEVSGKPLKDWDVKINYGIKTGLNEAFIITRVKRDELIAEDPKSVKIIKPILRGRDIKRYSYEFAELYILTTGHDLDIQNLYPAVYKHLLNFEVAAKARQDQGKNWYNLRACVYYHEFEKEKVVYSEIVRSPQFFLDSIGEFYAEASSFLMTGEKVKYICAMLNSKACTYFFKEFYAGGGLGKTGYRYKKKFLVNLPIPRITDENKKDVERIEKLVDNILQSKKENKDADTKDLEKEIDVLVYELYGLSEEEVRIIEESK